MGDFITIHEARNLMTEMLKEYEEDVIVPRHKETQDSLESLCNLVQQGLGMFKLAGFVGAVLSIVWVVMQIRGAK